MARIQVSVVIEAPPPVVWASLADISSHVQWMADAEAITITSTPGGEPGVGTTFDCLTRLGPIKLTDRMEVTEWTPGRVMGVRHTGVVTGTGRFVLAAAPGGATAFTWAEELTFPWWMGGPVGGFVGGRIVLGAIWRRNLANLKRLVETRAPVA